MPVSFTDPTIQRQGVVAGFVLSAPDYSGTPAGAGNYVVWSFNNADITVLGQTVKIGTGYQHWVNVGGAVFSYVQAQNSGCPNNTDSAAIVATALANAINSAADALATAVAFGGTLELAPRQNTGAAILCTASTSAWPYNQEQDLFELTGNELIPAISKGVLFAQGQLFAPTMAPTLPAAPASEKSWLFYSSATGWYWKSSATPNASDDACVGWVSTSATAVIALGARRIGTGDEAEILPAGPGMLGIATGEAGDTGVPPAPGFSAAETTTQLILGDVTFPSTSNTAGVDFIAFLLYYVMETGGSTLALSGALGASATSMAANATLPASTPGSVTFTFVALLGGLIPIGPGYQHTIEIGAQTYAYVQQTEDTPTTIAQALAAVINASPDPNARATAGVGAVTLTALQNTGVSVPCGASDGNSPQTLIETMPTYVAIDQEIIQVNAANGSAIARGCKGSTAAAHLVGATIWPVATMSMVFGVPLLAYGTPAWPTVIGQIPFQGCALVAADCWAANEIGPSPVTTECFSGQGPFAVDAYGVPLAPDVAGFTAGVTLDIEIAGQPYYQFSGTVEMNLAVGDTSEIDVAMTDANGTARTVYKYLGPFTANATVNWASVPYPQPTNGPSLVFTPTVIPLNPDLAPTVSAHQPAALTVTNGTPGAATAPNVTFTCQWVNLGGGNFGIAVTINLTQAKANPNWLLLFAGSITVTGGWAGQAATTIVIESGWLSSLTILSVTAGTPSANVFPFQATKGNFVVTCISKDVNGVAAPNSPSVTLAVPAGTAPALASAAASLVPGLIGNMAADSIPGTLGLPANITCLASVVLSLQITIGATTTTTPYATFDAATIAWLGAGGTINFGPAYGNTPNGLVRPAQGSDWAVELYYTTYNGEGSAGATAVIGTFPLYVCKVASVAAPTQTVAANEDGQPMVTLSTTATMYQPGSYGSGSGMPGSGAVVLYLFVSFNNGASWFYFGTVILATVGSTIVIAGIYAPTTADWTQCKIALAPCVSDFPVYNLSSPYQFTPNPTLANPAGPIASLPPGNAVSAAFTIAKVASCPSSDVTAIGFVNWPSSGLPTLEWLDSVGVSKWTFYRVALTLPTAVADPAAWAANLTFEVGSYLGGVWTPISGGAEDLCQSAQIGAPLPNGQGMCAAGIAMYFAGSVTKPLGIANAPGMILKARIYLASTSQTGWGTLQAGWAAQGGNTTSGSSWDLPVPSQVATLNLSQALASSLGPSLAIQQNITLTGVSGSFVVGDTVTGGTSGATGTVLAWNAATSMVSVQQNGVFVVGEALSDSAAAASGTIANITNILGLPPGAIVKPLLGPGSVGPVATGTTNSANPVFNPGFELLTVPGIVGGGASGWTLSAGVTVQSAVKASGAYALAMTGSSLTAVCSPMACVPGAQVVAQVYAEASAGATGNIKVGIAWYNSAGALIGTPAYGAAQTPVTPWTVVSSGIQTAPAGAVTFAVVGASASTITGNWYIDNVSVAVNSPAVSGSTVTGTASMPLSILAGGTLAVGTNAVAYAGPVALGQLSVAGTATFGGTATFQATAGGAQLILTSTSVTMVNGSNAVQISAAGISFTGAYSIDPSQIAAGMIPTTTGVYGSTVSGALGTGASVPGGIITGTASLPLTILGAGVLPTGTNAVTYSGAIGCGQIQAGTITASITLTSPIINGGHIDCVYFSCSSGASAASFSATTTVAGHDLAATASCSANNFLINGGFGSWSSVGMQVYGGINLIAGNTYSVGAQTGYSGTLAAAIAAGKSVVGGIVVS